MSKKPIKKSSKWGDAKMTVIDDDTVQYTFRAKKRQGETVTIKYSQIEEWKKSGLAMRDIAALLGVCGAVFVRWSKNNTRISNIIKSSIPKRRVKVMQKLEELRNQSDELPVSLRAAFGELNELNRMEARQRQIDGRTRIAAKVKAHFKRMLGDYFTDEKEEVTINPVEGE